MSNGEKPPKIVFIPDITAQPKGTPVDVLTIGVLIAEIPAPAVMHQMNKAKTAMGVITPLTLKAMRMCLG